MKREYLMLAQTFKPAKHNIGGWLWSEKLDGMRAFWDGGISRGCLATDVPYANTEKDARLKLVQVATGLWSRSGKIIYAPNAWLHRLPKCFLDGELFMGRGMFQTLRKVVGSHSATDPRWSGVTFQAFDSPSIEVFSQQREIKIRSEYSFLIPNCCTWIQKRVKQNHIETVKDHWTFELVQQFLANRLTKENCWRVKQNPLPLRHVDAVEKLNEILDFLVTDGAEGVMLRKPTSLYELRRSHNLLKHKPFNDAEGVVVGYTSGRETGRGSKHLGRIGALVLDFGGKRLELSGLTDEERGFLASDMRDYAVGHPGQDMPQHFQGQCFKIGQVVTFKYRELSDDGVPKEARYWRKR